MQRFVETVSIDNRLMKPLEASEIKEKISKLSEGRRKMVENIHAAGEPITAWEVPISKYDEVNANGRVYSRELWENVVNRQRHIWEGSPCLTDHPSAESDGNPEKICGVWLEARIADDGYVYGTFSPSGRLGEDLEDHLRKGLRAGTSSSGFGDLMHDNKTVDPSTYMIERLSDWVLTPSQGTYFTYETATQETKNASDSQRIGESANKPENAVRENVTMSKLTKLEEKKFKKDMEAFLEDAQNLGDPQERLQEFEEILSYFDEGASPELRENVVAKIDAEKADIRAKLNEAKKLQEELGVKDTADLKEKLTIIAEDTDILKEEAKDWKKIASALQEKLDATREELQSRPTNAYVSHLSAKMKHTYAEKRAVEQSAAESVKKISEATAKKDQLLEAIDAEIGEKVAIINEQAKDIGTLRSQIERLQVRCGKSESALKEAKNEFATYKATAEAKPKYMESPANAIGKYTSFREEASIDDYWADLAARHGSAIRPYENKIRNQKTLRDSQTAYMKILPFLNESVEYNAAMLPESVAINRKERGIMLEKVGANMALTTSMDRMPSGWL